MNVSQEYRPSGRAARAVRMALARRRVVIGLVVLAVLVVAAWLGPLLAPWEAGDRDYDAFLAPPSASHWWGTDSTGRDVFVTTLVGLRKSLVLGLAVAILSTAVAGVLGAVAGFYGGLTDRAFMRLADLLLILPPFLVLATLASVTRGGGWVTFVLLLAGLLWMVTARMARSMTLSLRQRDYVQAARYMGVPSYTIVLRHITPNLAPLLTVDVTMNVSGAIVLESALSYFGFGLRYPDVSLGTLIADGSAHAITHPWTFAFCTGLLVVVVLAVHLIGDGLRDTLDPRTRR